MSALDRHRHPAGTTTGGQFRATARTEPEIDLPAEPSPQHAATARLDESLVQGSKLADRISRARATLAGARRQHLIAAGLPDRVEDQMFWSERVVAAEEDLADLQGLYDGTVVGLALLAERHDRAWRDVHAMGSGREPVDPESYAAAEQDLRRSTRALDEASDPDLEPVLAGEDLSDDLGHEWSSVGMVAAGVTNMDRGEPAAWVVSFVDLPTRTEVGRMTVPNDAGASRLDRATVVNHVRALVTHPERSGDLAGDLLDRLPVRVDPAA